MRAYASDLAYIHHIGFGDFARKAAPGIFAILRRAGIRKGLIVDLGCGSGIWAAELGRNGYDVLGIDISPEMLELARKQAPRARFVQSSFLNADLPACDAITSIGEVLNYTFDGKNSLRELRRLFQRAYQALRPGGVFVFDVAEPGRALRRAHAEGKDWAILFEGRSDKDFFVRTMTTFRRVGELYRRDHEVHRLRLFSRAEVAAALRRVGFRVRASSRYGTFRLPAAHGAFVATKPGAT